MAFTKFSSSSGKTNKLKRFWSPMLMAQSSPLDEKLDISCPPPTAFLFRPVSPKYRCITYEEKNRTDHSILYPTSFVHSLSISHQEINIISVHLRNIIPLFLLEVDRWLMQRWRYLKISNTITQYEYFF